MRRTPGGRCEVSIIGVVVVVVGPVPSLFSEGTTDFHKFSDLDDLAVGMAYFNGSSGLAFRKRGYIGLNGSQRGPFSLAYRGQRQFSPNGGAGGVEASHRRNNIHGTSSEIPNFQYYEAQRKKINQETEALCNWNGDGRGEQGMYLDCPDLLVDNGKASVVQSGRQGLVGDVRTGTGNGSCGHGLSSSDLYSNALINTLQRATGNNNFSNHGDFGNVKLETPLRASGSYPVCEPEISVNGMSNPKFTNDLPFIPSNNQLLIPVHDGNSNSFQQQRTPSDQFGLAGLMSALKAVETDPGLVTLPIGFDLTTLLGYDLRNLPEEETMCASFSGPFGKGRAPAHTVEADVPAEYKLGDLSAQDEEFIRPVRDRLLPVKISEYKEDLLFYIFYNFTGDILQVAAARTLYDRDWRFHTEKRLWVARIPGQSLYERGPNFERGLYYIFDPTSWKKVVQECHIEMDKLETRPPVNMN